MHRRHLLNLILGSAVFALPFSVSATQIRSARLWRSDEKLRLVFDLSGPVQYKTFTLSAPERLIINVSGASLSADFGQLALDGTMIRSIRFDSIRAFWPGRYANCSRSEQSRTAQQLPFGAAGRPESSTGSGFSQRENGA